MSRLSSEGLLLEWDGELDESTDVVIRRSGQDPEVVPFSRVVALTNGSVLDDLAAQGLGGVESPAGGDGG